MNEPMVEIHGTRYGTIKFYRDSTFQTYLKHLDQIIKESLRHKLNKKWISVRDLDGLFAKFGTTQDNKKLIKKLWCGDKIETATTKIKKKRGRPTGSKNKSKLDKIQIDILQKKKAETHITKREPFETTKEFFKRRKEELTN